MNEVKTKRKWGVDTWTSELQDKFQQIKDLFTDPAGACHAHPMTLGEPGAGEFILITDYSKEAEGAILHQVQHEIIRFIGLKGRKCRGYKMNYHSSKGELLALDYGLKKFSKFLHQGPFTVRSNNATIIHWKTMNADENVAPCVGKLFPF